jgi:DNA polymerase-3 subunit delta
MAPSPLSALKSALKSGAFEPAYHFHGDEDFLKDAWIRDVIDHATDPATRDFNLETRRGGELDARALSDALDALPMMAERRVLVIRDVPSLKKEARGVLLKYLDHPAKDTLLILVSPAGAKADTKGDAEVNGKLVAIAFDTLSEDALTKWVAHRAGQIGVTITPSATASLCSAAGTDLALLAGELDKLRNYTNGGTIDDAAIEAIVGVRAGQTLGDLLDAVAQRDGVRGVQLVEPILLQPKTSGVSVVMAITTQVLAIGWALAARARGVPQHRMESELFGLLKANPSSLTGRPWGEAVKVWVRAMPNWNAADIDHALAMLLAADRSLKDSRVSSEEQVLVSLVLSLSAGRTRRAAA